MLNLALQMSLEPEANAPVRPGPVEPKPPTADAAPDATVEAPAPAVSPEVPEATAPAPAPEAAAPAAESAKKPRKKQRYKDLIGGMMAQQGDAAKKTAVS